MNKTKKMIFNSILLALLIIFGKISFQVGVIPFTLQLFIVFLIAFCCKLQDGLSIVFIYLLLGFIGFPFFSYGGGLAYIYQPSCGFLIGYIFLLITINILTKLFNKIIKSKFLIYFFAGIIGLLVNYLFGCLYAYVILVDYNYSITQFLQLVLFPFVGFDCLKLFLSILLINRFENYFIKK